MRVDYTPTPAEKVFLNVRKGTKRRGNGQALERGRRGRVRGNELVK